MYEYITGVIVEKTPTYVVLETEKVGYFVNISLYTYTKLPEDPPCQLYIHLIVREDAHILFGFIDKHEREIFRQLISVSGIGANTARMILSSLTPGEIERAINEGNVQMLKNIKGIGVKSAQRIIVDLKGKITREPEIEQIFKAESNTIKEESLSALVNLGFSKSAVEKVIQQILIENNNLSVEELIKEALKKI